MSDTAQDFEEEITWEDLVERDILGELKRGGRRNGGVIRRNPDDSWWHEDLLTFEEWNKQEYERIQEPESREWFDEYWREKMKYKKNGAAA